MSNINVSYDSIDSAAGQLDTGRENLTQQIEALNRLIEDLVSNGFVTSSASGAYQETFQQYSNGAKQTIATLEQFAKFLRNAMDTIRETDEQLAQRFR
jgi:WXG100 family type VII secretion target